MARGHEGQAAPALHEIVVLDLTQFEAGTSCTQALAWLGASVIKVERPISGEQGRYAHVVGAALDAYYFILLNSNKRSLTLDLKTPEGHELFMRLLDKADVLVENFRPGVMDTLGLDYETVAARNERVVYASIKGYGEDTRFGDFGAFDVVAQAAGGAMSITGDGDGPPMRSGATHPQCSIPARDDGTWPEGDGQHAGVRHQSLPSRVRTPARDRSRGGTRREQQSTRDQRTQQRLSMFPRRAERLRLHLHQPREQCAVDCPPAAHGARGRPR
jgi:hypothetical protein